MIFNICLHCVEHGNPAHGINIMMAEDCSKCRQTLLQIQTDSQGGGRKTILGQEIAKRNIKDHQYSQSELSPVPV